MKVSQLKAQLQSIINNIAQLEKLNTTDAANIKNFEEIQKEIGCETHVLLSQVEQQTSHRLLRKLKKRVLKRRLKNKSKRSGRKATTSCFKQTTEKDKACVAATPLTNKEPQVIVAPVNVKPKQNEFQQLHNYQQAQRYLRSFELLEMLHLARSQDTLQTQQFHEKLAQLRSLWNHVLLENTPKRTHERRIEDQWNEVIFGASEQTFYAAAGRKTERERQREFLRIRQTWDTYLVRNKKHGSSIPLGWVLPKNKASESWEQYKIP